MTIRGFRTAHSRETFLLLLCFGLVVLLRLLTVARDPWEWDEVLFMQAAREGLDVRLSHPHAPGYPGFVYPARALVLIGVPPFEAVTAVGFVGGLLSVLGVFALLRALGSERRFAGVGAAAFALIPSVWLHSVRPLSDAPGVAAFLFAAALLVRAMREGSERDLVLAGALSALAAGIRPQNGIALLPIAAVSAFGVWRRHRRGGALAWAFATGALLTLVIWTPAIRSSGGLHEFRGRLEGQMTHVRDFDRPGAKSLVDRAFWRRWLVDPVGRPEAVLPVFAIALAGFLDRRRALAAVALFGAAGALSVFSLDSYVAPRYALAFLPLLAVLVAIGCERLGRGRGGRSAVPATALALLWMVAPAVSAITEVHERPSPSVAALSDARRFPGRMAFVHPSLAVHARELLPASEVFEMDEERPLAPAGEGVIAWADGELVGRSPVVRREFASRRVLERISRGRYLSVSLYDPAAGAAHDVVRVAGKGWWNGALAALEAPGASFSLKSACASAWVRCVVDTDTGVELAVATAERERLMRFGPGEHPLELHASANVESPLVRITVVHGRTDLRDFRIDTSAPPSTIGFLSDPLLPSSVDDPPEGAVLPSGPVLVRGWCQMPGGRKAEPFSVEVDGFSLTDFTVKRVPRGDVSAALPQMGDTSAAGYEMLLPAHLFPGGKHVLVVSFRSGDRIRRYERRTFTIRP